MIRDAWKANLFFFLFLQSLAEAAIEGYTVRGMQVAQETLVSAHITFCFMYFPFSMSPIWRETCFPYLQEKMNARGFFLNAKMGNDLLLAASGEKVNERKDSDFYMHLIFMKRVCCVLEVWDTMTFQMA